MTEVEPEDRPTDEEIQSDELFNKWLEHYERKAKRAIQRKLELERKLAQNAN